MNYCFFKTLSFSIKLLFFTQFSLLAIETPSIRVKIPWPWQESLPYDYDQEAEIEVWVSLSLPDEPEIPENDYFYSSENIKLNIKKEDGSPLIFISDSDYSFFDELFFKEEIPSISDFYQIVSSKMVSGFPVYNSPIIIRRLIIFLAIKSIIEIFFIHIWGESEKYWAPIHKDWFSDDFKIEQMYILYIKNLASLNNDLNKASQQRLDDPYISLRHSLASQKSSDDPLYYYPSSTKETSIPKLMLDHSNSSSDKDSSTVGIHSSFGGNTTKSHGQIIDESLIKLFIFNEVIEALKRFDSIKQDLFSARVISPINQIPSSDNPQLNLSPARINTAKPPKRKGNGCCFSLFLKLCSQCSRRK